MLLIACSSCSRQYDVTGLEPGAQVRCICDAMLNVGWPKQLTGQALLCTHCGGAVTVEAEACPYCSAKISEADRRQTTLCPGCYTRIDDDSKHCRSCGINIEPQALAPLPADRGCPRCKGQLRTRALEHAEVIECGECLGIWLTPKTFDRTLLEAERKSFLSALSLTEAPKPTARNVEAVGYIPCLNCGELMNRRQYRYAERSSGVVIDACRHHGVWLDHEELERIMSFIRAGGTGGPGNTLPDPKAFVPVRRSSRPLRGSSGGGSDTFLAAELFGWALEGVASLLFWEL
jgi:Zn-finger nucleic acid-binding protein